MARSLNGVLHRATMIKESSVEMMIIAPSRLIRDILLDTCRRDVVTVAGSNFSSMVLDGYLWTSDVH